ncbi:hypothetical protein CEXT_732071 [Caerostris extrusa]|uniref:Uncharacterized protein n=1 Tax=Caerostris extrusa TaxID=172846 RepID=A0AAV4T5I2_CAEEX|nr:hypothetical protein CEXT_732071 [Caerostris extrusa]
MFTILKVQAVPEEEGSKEKAYVQEEFADFEANQHQCVLNSSLVHKLDEIQPPSSSGEPLAASPRDARSTPHRTGG